MIIIHLQIIGVQLTFDIQRKFQMNFFVIFSIQAL
jgi:hypothetical protein